MFRVICYILFVFQVPKSAPEKVTNTSVCNTSISVIRDPVSCLKQRGPITAYKLWYSNGAENITFIIFGANNRTHELTGLTPSTSYTIAVAAVNDGCTGPYSDPPLTVWTLVSRCGTGECHTCTYMLLL